MEAESTIRVPRVAIRFCTQCKWNLRAAYYAQELLQTFSTTLGEVSLIPVSGGIFDITLYHTDAQNQSETTDTDTSTVRKINADELKQTLLWDRKRDGGFPETKELKNRVRNLIDPQRDMGHVDRALKKIQKQHVEDQEQDKILTNDQAISSPTNKSSHNQYSSHEEVVPVAAGGESLDFGIKKERTVLDEAKANCEDCK